MLIVAVHDVAPSTLAHVRWLLARLDDAGIAPRVLKVIPSEPDAGGGDGGELAALVAAEAAAGSEIVLHGWSHRQEGPLRGATLDRWRASALAGGTAEFLALSPGGMERRLADGCARLRGWGANPSGFCAPGWLAAPGWIPAARAAGLRYGLTLRGLRDFDRGRWLTLPPWGYMGAGARQELLVRVGAAVIARPLAGLLRAPAVRVFLHPQGAPGSRACGDVLRRLERLARRHRSMTYAGLLDA